MQNRIKKLLDEVDLAKIQEQNKEPETTQS